MKTPDFRVGTLRYYHVLKGAYVQPQLVLGAFNSTFTYRYYVNDPNNWYRTTHEVKARETTTYASLLVVFGKQAVFANVFLVDLYVGAGYGFSYTTNKNKPEQLANTEYRKEVRTYGTVDAQMSVPIAVSAGLKLGFLTK